MVTMIGLRDMTTTFRGVWAVPAKSSGGEASERQNFPTVGEFSNWKA